MNIYYALLATMATIAFSLVALIRYDRISSAYSYNVKPMRDAFIVTTLSFLPPFVFFGCLMIMVHQS